jgi:hypothetical protein
MPTLTLTPTRTIPGTAGAALLLLSLSWLGTVRAAGAEAEDVLRYNRDVRPILAEACFRCHGPGEKKAGLRLDVPDAALATTASGIVPIVPGDPEASEIIRRIESDDDGELMPPPKARKPLTPEQKRLLRRWVASGARSQRHWAFEPPIKEAVPELAGPRPRPQVNNPIDAFLADRLRREGLTNAPEADRATLIRRVAFALTGLPPKLAEVDTYLADASPRAYENLVERYLASPRYGEEMARSWLDVARYADTHGLHLDNERQMWPYRDWVVQAFNANMPFDQFTIEQLAGDLLPAPTRPQLVATGFNRCNVTTSEGGSIEVEWTFRNAVDRASTMAEAWLGLTAGCAVCHDHKYDPITQKEFYSLYAFFYSAAGPSLDGNKLRHEPFLKLSTPGEDTRLADLNRQIAATRDQIASRTESLAYRDPADADADAEEDEADEPTPTADPAPVADADADTDPDTDPALTTPRPRPRANVPGHSFQAWLKQGGAPEVKEAPAEIKALLNQLKRGKQKPTAPAEATLRDYYLQHVCIDTKERFQPLVQQLAELTKQHDALDASVPSTFIFREMDRPRDAFVMLRGQYDRPGEAVAPGTPAVLPPLRLADPTRRATRLDLAHWLVAPEHPLTARVAVNRFWQQFFGTGLVKTSFDFGTQGEPPSHPELLDWLAVNFREGGWDVKALVRQIVTSAAFRQAARITPEVLKRDPDNRLYARGPRFRLDAEQIRDNALFVAGLIDLTIGGKGVKPYQPPNIWEPVAYVNSNTRYYQQDRGPALYRRSLYTFLKRTAPAPFLANFDVPSREAFCTRRERSNTPLQALQLMNDVQHVEAARGLAVRMLAEGGRSPVERLGFGVRVVLARPPADDELAILQAQLQSHLERFEHDPEAARQLGKAGDSPPTPGLPETELAAYTLVANTLLNLDETITRN